MLFEVPNLSPQRNELLFPNVLLLLSQCRATLVQTLTNCRECLGLVALRDPNLNLAKFCWKLTPRMTA